MSTWFSERLRLAGNLSMWLQGGEVCHGCLAGEAVKSIKVVWNSAEEGEGEERSGRQESEEKTR